MAGRSFSVKIDLNLHAVSCPGVWLCPTGKVFISMNIFESCIATHKLKSVFPFLFHNKFTFRKVFTGVATLADLQEKLSDEYVYAELIQCSSVANTNIPLATFEANLVDVLYPVSCFKGLLAGVDVDLLMEPTKFFPGILSPKLEVSTRTTIEEVSNCDPCPKQVGVINPKIINSISQASPHKKKVSLGNTEIIRQQKVCHTGQGKLDGYICRLCRRQQNNRRCQSGCNSNRSSQHSTDKCYLLKTQEKTCKCSENIEQNPNENYSICADAHILDNCPICLKYKCYFLKKKFNDTNTYSKSCNKIVHKNIQCNCSENKSRCTSACNFERESCNNNVSRLSNTINSLHLEDDTKNTNCPRSNRKLKHSCCNSKRYKNSSVCRTNSVTSLREDATTSVLLAKIKQLEQTKDRLISANCRDRYSCCTGSDNSNDIRKGYYKNLEKFYKKMYKQAKKRADDLDDC